MDLNRITNPYASPLAADEPPDKLPPPVPPMIRWEICPALLMGGLAIGHATGGCAGLLTILVAPPGARWRMAPDLTVNLLLLLGAACGIVAAWCWWHRHWPTAIFVTAANLLLVILAMR